MSPSFDVGRQYGPRRLSPTTRSQISLMTAPSYLQRPVKVRSICCIGAGYVGGPTCSVIAAKNPDIQVTVVDLNRARINAWKSDSLPIYEPGLQEVVEYARDGGPGRPPNLFFSTDIDAAIDDADLIFVSVNTPAKATGAGAGRASELSFFESAIRKIAEVATSDKIVVEKSTVPCRTADNMREILAAVAHPDVHFEILSNPEFLAEGTAIRDLLRPDRILIGSLQTESGSMAAAALADIYAAWVPREKIITMNLWSSELSKLAANALLAQRISSINALSALCEATGADVDEVSYAVGLDTRIGPKMLKASVGFGGSCFKKDILSLAYMCSTLHLPEVAAYWRSVVDINEYQKSRFTRRITSCLFNSLANKKIAVLGFAYKKDTGDTRESAAISIVTSLVDEGAQIAVYDPRVTPAQIWTDLHAASRDADLTAASVSVHADVYQACAAAHAIVILTEWDEFSNKIPAAARRVKASRASAQALGLSTTMEKGVEAGRMMPEFTPPSTPPAPPVLVAKPRMDWARVAKSMLRPMFVFDGRNVVDCAALEELGFRVECIGKVGSGPAAGGGSGGSAGGSPRW